MTMAGLIPGSLSPPHPPGDITTGGLELTAESNCDKKPGLRARLGPAGSLPDLGCLPSALGGTQGSFLLALGCLRVEKGQMQLGESKRPAD